MNNQKLLSLLIVSMVLLVSANAQTLAQYCNLKSQGRFSTQYGGDASNQRCSFCQFTDNNKSQFQTGCSTCPDYATGTCSACKDSYVFMTESKMCIPCANEGQSCCASNNPLQDTYYQTAVKNALPNTQAGLQQTFSQLGSYTGLRQIQCKTGYFALGHVCVKQPTGCATVTVKDNWFYCAQCSTGYYFNEDNVCVNTCSATYISNTNDVKPNQPCGGCISQSKCSSCDATKGYYFLDNASSSEEKINDPAGTTKTTIQYCKECPSNCIDCSTNQNSCKVCAPYFYLDQNACVACPSPDDFVLVAQGTSIKQYYSTCTSGDKQFASYKWNANIPGTLDTLAQPANRPIIKLTDTKYTACEANCIQCDVNADKSGTKCQKCANGFYLDLTTPAAPTCTQCPGNSVLCSWNDSFKKPQIIACDMNNSFTPPYADAFYLQVSFDKYGTDASKYDSSKQCIKNINSCKTMINELGKEALCASCYTLKDFAPAAGVPIALYQMTTSKICKICPVGTDVCIADPDNQDAVIPQSCIAAGYQTVPVNKACVKCNAQCATCDKDGKCTSCNTSKYFTQINADGTVKDCLTPKSYTTNSSPMEGCLDWGRDTDQKADYTSCKTCAPQYTLVNNVIVDGKTQDKLSLCMACPDNCTSCNNGTNRLSCTACAAGYYLSNSVCLKLPVGCATFNGTKCTVCKYGYRLINDQWCSQCTTGSVTFSGGEWFDCPGAQCASGSSDDPTSSSSSTNSTLLSIASLCLLIVSLLI